MALSPQQAERRGAHEKFPQYRIFPPKTDFSEVNCYNVFFLNQMLSIGQNCRDGSGGVEIILNNFENPEVKLRSSNRILLFIAYSQ